MLLVDDKESNRVAIKASIEAHTTWEIVTAASGEEALDMLLKYPFICVLMDLRMPGGMNGLETAEMIRQHPNYASLPILFLSAEHLSDDEMTEVFKYEYSDFATKAIKIDHLTRRVNRLVIEANYASQQKAQSIAIKAANDSLINVLDSLPEAVYIFDSKGDLLYENQTAKIQCGDNKPSLLGMAAKFGLDPDHELFKMDEKTTSMKVNWEDNFISRTCRITSSEIVFSGQKAFQLLLQDITTDENLLQAISRSEEQYRQYWTLTPSMIFAVNESGVVIRGNPMFQEVMDKSIDDLIGHDAASLFSEPAEGNSSEWIGWSEFISQTWEKEKATLKTEGGRVLRVNSAESVTNKGLVTSVFAADVTSYLDVIRSLEEVKVGFQQLFETKFSGLVVIDYDSGVIIEANQRAHEILGSESLKGTHVRQFMAIGDYRSAANIATAYHEPVGSLELRIKSGLSDRSFPCAIYHETTEIFGKKCKLGWLMTGKTLDAVMVYQKILDSSSTSIVFYDSDGLIHHANPRAKRTFGKVLSGSNIADLVDCESCQDIFFTPDGPLTEVNMIGRLGHFWGQLKVSEMRHHGRDMLLVVIEDISEKKMLMQTLSDAMLEREELKLIKNRFVSIVSHEMRSPLTSIRSSSELIEMFLDDEKTLTTCKPHLERIDRNVTYMVEFLEDALLIGEMKTAASRFSPKKIIIEDLRHQIYDSAESSGYSGRLDFSDDVWNQEIFCDSGLLLHAIQNLLGNAAKYSSSKAPILVDGKTADGMVILTVKDFGIGMTEDDIEKVFQQFHRGKNVGSVKGTGMGLLIVKNIMDLHAGWVKIDSDPGVGSQVSLIFPVVDTDVIIKNIADPTESFQDQPAFR